MVAIALLFCLLVLALGALGLFWPPRFLDLVRRLTSLQGFYILAVLRIALLWIEQMAHRSRFLLLILDRHFPGTS